MHKTLSLLVSLVVAGQCLAQDQPPSQSQPAPSPLTMLNEDYLNSVELLQNRFRIDYKIDEITLIFFRDYGSAPIVLVRPDGSKIFPRHDGKEGIQWYDEASYDLIRISQPMPGPWQAVGQLLPGSRVMVLSDLKLEAEPLPELLFSGELIKLKAILTNGGKPINYNEIRDVVELNVEFLSTNNPNFTNFGADSQQVARYEDNGMGVDEYPLDGTFTGQFNLNITEGQWKPVYRVITPMFTREDVKEPLVIHPNPINMSVQKDEGDGRHRLVIDVERELVDISSLLIDGKIRYPNGDVQSFSLTEGSDEARVHEILNIEYGVYRVKAAAYGSTVDGRDFILDVPEFSFLSEEPELAAETLSGVNPQTGSELPSTEQQIETPTVSTGQMERGITAESPPLDEAQEGMSSTTLWAIILAANGLLLVAGGTLIWLTLGKKSSGKAAGNTKGRFSLASIRLPSFARKPKEARKN